MANFDTKWNAYSGYYKIRALFRKLNYFELSDSLIQVSFNTLYPGKEVAVEIPSQSSDFDILEFPQNKEHFHGLCAGMSVDHMNRVRNSKLPFWETIKNLGKKFSKGATKKGYINQQILKRFILSEEGLNKCEKNLSNELVKISKQMNLFKKKSSEEIDIIIKTLTEIILPYIVKAESYSLIIKNYRLSWSDKLKDDKPLPNGDYLISQYPKDLDHSGHLISLYKRNEGYVVFDANYGTLFFSEDKKFFDFIKESIKSYSTFENCHLYKVIDIDNQNDNLITR